MLAAAWMVTRPKVQEGRCAYPLANQFWGDGFAVMQAFIGSRVGARPVSIKLSGFESRLCPRAQRDAAGSRIGGLTVHQPS